MKKPYRCDLLRRGVVILVVLTASAWAQADQPRIDPIQDDALLTAKEIVFFKDGPEHGVVALGGFRLTIGPHSVSGRDAVVWVRTYTVGKATRHAIIVYAEGDAKIDEPGGTTWDKKILAALHNEGAFEAKGSVAKRAAKESALYKRALAHRKSVKAHEIAAAEKLPARKAPALVTEKPGKKRPKLAAGEKPKRPKPAGKLRVLRPVDGKGPGTVVDKPPAPVHFHADKFESTQEGKQGRRITVARGNVYISQGDPDSENFLELRAEDAVIISRRLAKGEQPPEKDVRHPLSPKMGKGAREVIVGAYLEGDVVIARGERFMRGPSAFYHFASDRAIMPNVVFRTVQGQRNVPVYVRAKEARMLSARETVFRDAKVSTSDFYTPSYHIGARPAYLMHTTEYSKDGKRLGPARWLTKLEHPTFNVRGFPLLYLGPYHRSEVEQGHTALRKASIGRDSSNGFGVETEWHLFRLLGLIRPEGVKANFNLDLYERESTVSIDWDYERQNFTGYGVVAGSINRDEQDDFGEERKDVQTNRQRGRILARHKHFLPKDWQAQFELSYVCDPNYIEAEFADEFYGGKEQETLIYAKKQRDNWALTSLLQARLNRFYTRTESFPDVAFHLIGQPLLQDRLTFFSESRIGGKRWRPANFRKLDDSNAMVRVDTRNEINLPMKFGPINVVPYGLVRLTYWGDDPEDGKNFRPMLYGGVKANAHIWSVNNNVKSRFWDLNGIKHVITPEVVGWLGTTGNVDVDHVYPMDPDIETHLGRLSGLSFAVRQRWQTKRGGDKKRPPHVVDWMRLDIVATAFSTSSRQPPADGRLFEYRPENSIGQNHINFDYTWNISDATTLMADMNIDVDGGTIGRSGVALAVSRDPRLRYFLGLRTIHDLDSIIGTFGLKYKINRKYTLTFFEQYDFDYKGGENNLTSVSLVRKFPRWYVAVTVQFDQRQDDLSLMFTLWPEGIPEAEVRSGRMSILAGSDKN